MGAHKISHRGLNRLTIPSPLVLNLGGRKILLINKLANKAMKVEQSFPNYREGYDPFCQ